MATLAQQTQGPSQRVEDASLQPVRISIDDYYKMADVGVLDDNKRYELLDGVIYHMLPIGSEHGYFVKRLGDQLSACSQGHAEIFTQHPVQIPDYSEPQPDVLVLKPPLEQYRSRHPTPQDVLLLVEVAHTTLRTDRTLKLTTYARAGIPEYWIVNLTKMQLEIHRHPDQDEGRYRESHTLSEGELATPAAFGACQLAWWQ